MSSPELAATSPLAEPYRALLGVGVTLLGCSDSQALYKAIYTETANLVGLSGFSLALYDSGRDVATVVLYVAGGKELESGFSYGSSDCEVLRTGAPTSVENQIDPGPVPFPEAGEGDIARSTISVPLLDGKRVTAAMTVYSLGSNVYDATDVDVLGTPSRCRGGRSGEHGSRRGIATAFA